MALLNTRHPQEVENPSCSKCGRPMLIVRIEPSDKPGYDQRTFECSECDVMMLAIVKYR
jgi:hypothetical protein